VLGGLCGNAVGPRAGIGFYAKPDRAPRSSSRRSRVATVSLRALSLRNVCLHYGYPARTGLQEEWTWTPVRLELQGTSAADRASARCRCREQRRCK
jgi:hypothetical protein